MSRRKQSRPQYFDYDEKYLQYAGLGETKDKFSEPALDSTPQTHVFKEAAFYEENISRKEMVGCNQTLTESQLDASLLNSTDSQIEEIPQSDVRERESHELNSIERKMEENTSGLRPDSTILVQNSLLFGRSHRPTKNGGYPSSEVQSCDFLKNLPHDNEKPGANENGVRLSVSAALDSSVRCMFASSSHDNEGRTESPPHRWMSDSQDGGAAENRSKRLNKSPTSKPFEGSDMPGSSANGDGESEKQNKFSCIVCAMDLPDVATLQRHILSEHMNTHENEILRRRSDREKVLHGYNGRSNHRKVSTVSPPKLSLLSDVDAHLRERTFSNIGGASTSWENASELPVVELERDSDIGEMRQKKKRGNGDGSDETFCTDVASEYNRVKKIKKDVIDSHEIREKSEALAEYSVASRRVSCPSMCRNNVASSSCEVKNLKIPNILENDRYCVECDINFSSPENFRAHKQFYCASRHMEKFREVYQLNFDTPQADVNKPQSISIPSRSKPSYKRNIGNRSSMTPRKRSHLIPLQSHQGIPCTDAAGAKERNTCLHKSAGSLSDEAMAVPLPDAYDPHSSATNAPKKHFCEECNIWFSKYDTYIAHKKYYCESRRKDRLTQKSIISSRTQVDRRSETNFLKSSNSILLSPDEQRSSSPESSPNMQPEEKHLHQGTAIESNISTERRAVRDPFTAPFLYFNHSESNIFARLSCMHPFVLSHYMSMLQQKMTTEIQGKLDIYANAFRRASLETLATPSGNDRKLSVDESRLTLSNTVDFTSLQKPNRPNRQSCAAVINIKQEPGNPEERLESIFKIATKENNPAFPLDLRSKTDHGVQGQCTGDPVVDISKTSDGPVSLISERDPHSTECINKDREQQVEMSNVSVSLSSSHVSQEIMSKSKHCKGCDVRFTSLSAFIAHKKYYCTANNSSSVLAGKETKPAQLAH